MKAEQRAPSRRLVDWSSLAEAARSCSRSERTVVGESWRERMRQEHLAVGAFAEMTRELAAIGCDSTVLELVARASSDEVRHAEICRRAAVALLGEKAVPRGWRGLPNIPAYLHADAATRALLHVVEMCCLSETMTGVFLTEMRARATHPAARAMVEFLLEDEIDHGRAGWAYLALRANARTLDGLAQTLPEMLDRTFGRVLRMAETIEDGDAPEGLGYVRSRACGTIFRRTLRDVVLPGLEMAGVDLSPSRTMLASLLRE